MAWGANAVDYNITIKREMLSTIQRRWCRANWVLWWPRRSSSIHCRREVKLSWYSFSCGMLPHLRGLSGCCDCHSHLGLISFHWTYTRPANRGQEGGITWQSIQASYHCKHKQVSLHAWVGGYPLMTIRAPPLKVWHSINHVNQIKTLKLEQTLPTSSCKLISWGNLLIRTTSVRIEQIIFKDTPEYPKKENYFRLKNSPWNHPNHPYSLSLGLPWSHRRSWCKHQRLILNLLRNIDRSSYWPTSTHWAAYMDNGEGPIKPMTICSLKHTKIWWIW